MRKMLAAAMVLAVTSVNAEELRFGDLNYFIKTGELNVAADVNSVFSKTTYARTQETRGIITEARVGYGITDQLNVYAGLDYAFDLETEDKDSDPEFQDFSSDGFANPLLAANYRFMNQNDGMYNIDFGAVARINVQDAETGYGVAGDSKDGTFTGLTDGWADPRSSLELNARIGKKWNEANEWQLAAGWVYFTDGESDLIQPGSGDLEFDSSMNLYLRASYQYRPVETFMMLVSLQGTQVGEVEGKYDGADLTDDSHLDFDLDFVAKYLITDNFIAKFNYSMGLNPDFDREVGGTTEEVRQRRENSFGLGVEFLF